jgi:glutathione S-transferase
MSDTPVLHHLKVSHYNEKVRWALDYKGIPHVRKAALPGRHRKLARELTGGATKTFPVLVENGYAIGDSSRIIAHLEDRYPEPPLYPKDLADRRRALDLEDFFDEQLGPFARLLVVHHELPDARLFLKTFVPDADAVTLTLARLQFPIMRRRIRAGFGIDDHSVAHALHQMHLAGERFRAELQPNGYLIGDNFSVADLTLASLVAPIVAPRDFPYPQPQRDHARLEPLRDVLDEYGLLDWTRDMYTRKRRRSAAIQEQ